MKLKICGIKYEENSNQVANLQPDYMGFIFYKKSPRFFDGNIPKLPESIKKVGVFVDETIETILDKIITYNLQAIQLHGSESPEFCEELQKQTQHNQSLEIIKVFSIKDEFDFSILKSYETVCDYYLFDTKGKEKGGNGYTFNWTVLKEYPSTKPYFLSGGIGLEELENIQSFINKQESQYCFGLDINSKFEIKAGLKDIEKLKKFKNNSILNTF